MSTLRDDDVTSNREIKSLLFEQVARVGKAAASPKRLELIQLLCQGEMSVETLAQQADLDGKSASAHLKELKAARLVRTRKVGRYVHYRLSDDEVVRFWVALRTFAEARFAELRQLERLSLAEHPVPPDRQAMIDSARRGKVIVIDVRPANEFATGHLPFARSMPMADIEGRLRELPRNKDIVVYCRGPFGLLARDAVTLLLQNGFRARLLDDGIAEWRVAGLPIETNVALA
ncbi:MAG: metalloregulator ArsR/SmtB family transcription factor [Betaproteobacteria bacterium]